MASSSGKQKQVIFTIDIPIKKGDESNNEVSENRQSIVNHLSMGILTVAILSESLGLLLMYKRNSNNAHFFGVVWAAHYLLMAIISITAVNCFLRSNKTYISSWSIVLGVLTTIVLLACLISSSIAVGDEHYLFWNPSSSRLTDMDDPQLSSSITSFSYNVARSSDKSTRYYLPRSEFYDISATMTPNNLMNLTETRKFLRKFNCYDKLSFPTLLDSLLTQFKSKSICV